MDHGPWTIFSSAKCEIISAPPIPRTKAKDRALGMAARRKTRSMAAEAAGAGERTYYDVLGLPNRAGTLHDIKAAYHRALLAAHPDKVSGTTGAEVDLIREAWTILSNEDTRKEYDAKLKSNKPLVASGLVNLVSVDGLIIKDSFVSVDLDDMSYSPETLKYSFPCRCGKSFTVAEDDLERGRDLVEGKGCSSWIRISYGILAE